MRLKSAAPLSLATATGPVFALLDPPGTYDRDGDRMDASALRLPPGHPDVPLYWVHGHRQDEGPERIPVGRARVWREGEQWYMAPTFDEVDEQSRTIAAKVAAGTITACSIGYLTLAAAPNGAGPVGKGEDVVLGELLEVSLVGIGAKAGAMRVKSMSAKRKWKTVDEAQAGMEGMAADMSAVKEQLGQLLTLVQQLAGGEEDAEEEDTEAKDGEDAPAEGSAEGGAVMKWLKALPTSGRR